MVQRQAAETLMELAGQFPVVAVTGPRQSGKTTLCRMVFPEKEYVSFDDKSLREIARMNPVSFLEAFPNGVIIDEAQKVPDIFDAVKLYADKDPYAKGKFILTGSSQFRLRENISDSLAGRVAFLRLLPFSVGELSNAGLVGDSVYDLIFKGQYPPLYDSGNRYSPDRWYENYLQTYLEMDVRENIDASNLSVFRKFMQLTALYSGQIVSMESMSRDLGVSAPTVKSWLSILESSFIIHFLEPDTDNLGKNLIKSPKLYFIDSGLLCYLLRFESKSDLLLNRRKGAVVETFAVAELLKRRYNRGRRPNLTYFRDRKGFEVDTIADWTHSYAIEIKSDSEPSEKQSGNLKKYLTLRNNPETGGAVLYLGEYSFTIDGIRFLCWKDWDKL